MRSSRLALSFLALALCPACSAVCAAPAGDPADAFADADGTYDLEVGGISGGDDSGALFTVGDVYSVEVIASSATLSFASNNGTVSRCYDDSSDRVDVGAQPGSWGIVIVDADRGGAGANYNVGEQSLVGASWSLAGGVPVYSFIPPGPAGYVATPQSQFRGTFVRLPCWNPSSTMSRWDRSAS